MPTLECDGYFIDRGYAWVPVPSGALLATKRCKCNGVACPTGYVKRCHMVVFLRDGRPVGRGNCVHHIDGNKLNDNPSNLVVMSMSEHSKYHGVETPVRRRPGAPVKGSQCANCTRVCCGKRGLCNGCYLKAKRSKNKYGYWPAYAGMFPTNKESLHIE